MRRTVVLIFALAAGLAFAQAKRPQPPADAPLKIYFIDVEGGQSTLFVTPSGESMLIDTGYPGFGGRDANRVLAAIEHAGVSRLDYLLVTHYHADHAGNAAVFAEKLAIGTFVDHGATVEQGDNAAALYGRYVEARAKGRHLQVKPGDRIPIAGVDVTVVSSNGDVLQSPLPGAGAPNLLCASSQPKEVDDSENARSVGTVISYGRFRMVDLGDLTWNKEHDLACPANKIGTVDLYLTTHHGLDRSGPAVLVHALHPRVAIMNNGPKKGGSASAWQIVHDSPGLEDLWQLHYAVDGGAEHNVPERFIANMDQADDHMPAFAIELAARKDGSFTVTNTRNGIAKKYDKN
ncbi:MAG: MBL fold metallo-hydrolase [Acidobacteria bacterium]|nr:MAG: MBL fold metallo-hydrolase [Acidobacteriota bacterium]